MKTILVLAVFLALASAYTKCPASDSTLGVERENGETWVKEGWNFKCTITDGAYSVQPGTRASEDTSSAGTGIKGTGAKPNPNPESGTSEHKCPASDTTLNVERSNGETWMKDGFPFKCIVNADGSWSAYPQ